jgi:putative ABC transport system permease protein
VNVNLGPAGDSTWKVVGSLVDINNGGKTVFVPREAFSRALRQPGRGDLFWIKTDRHDGAYQAAMEKQLRAAFEANSMKVNYSLTAGKNKEQNFATFNIITLLLLAMSVLAGVVGSFGLMGTMSINVLERSKEIGVMRAIGASSPTIVAIFVVEGVIVGLLSLIIAVPLSYPGSRLLADALGNLFFQTALDFQYSAIGLSLWLMIVVVLAVLASLWPAMRAARVSVRETLAYE